MSVRVVARIRPLLKTERELDVIVRPGSTASPIQTQRQVEKKESVMKTVGDSMKAKKNKRASDGISDRNNIVRIPNPKNEGEEYSFQFNGVYDGSMTQQELFDAEVAPSIKHLFNGFDVTIFAYGVTGTGKTHTMRGGKSLVDRGIIPRMLSSIYRRSRKIEKDSQGASKVDVVMSYYEIYNDKVFDLFEPPEKRTATGLPLRDGGGKTVVVGLTERPCPSVKEFEVLYDQANMNRSTSATKLNAHSSRSHAILCVKLIVTTGEHTRISTASAIDLAGSEDNRRTDNNKERMVESASINKSLFVLAQCVEAISKKHNRIPYRESKMTRILSLGQNNGLTIMILNLAPIRSYHLDTLSSLNFANRTKKIEVREVENEPIFKGPPRPAMGGIAGSSIQKRQPLRPLAASVNANLAPPTTDTLKKGEGKPAKAFAVYSDKPAAPRRTSQSKRPDPAKRCSPLKRRSDASSVPNSRPSKIARSGENGPPQGLHGLSAAKIQELVEKKVEEALAARDLNEVGKHNSPQELNEEVQRRLEMLEQRIEGSEDARAEGLSYLLMAKQHQSRGEDTSALKMLQLAMPFFPSNEKLAGKILALKEKIKSKTQLPASPPVATERQIMVQEVRRPRKRRRNFQDEMDDDDDDEYREPDADDQFSEDNDSPVTHRRKRAMQTKMCKLRKPAQMASTSEERDPITVFRDEAVDSPRTRHILSVVNSRDISQIRLLRGVGVKKAEAIAECLCGMDRLNAVDYENGDVGVQIRSLAELGRMKGVGMKTVESMRNGVEV